MDFPVPKWCREPLATLSKMDMQVCPLILCNFFQKGLAKNNYRGYSNSVVCVMNVKKCCVGIKKFCVLLDVFIITLLP